MTPTAGPSFASAWSVAADRAREILPGLILLALVLIVGLVAGAFAGWLVASGLRAVRFDRLADRIGMRAALQRAGLPEPPSTWIGRLAAGFVSISFLFIGLASLRIPGTETAFDRGIGFLPSLVAAILILVAGVLLAQFLARATLIAAVNGGVASARGLAGAVRWLVISLAAAMTLDELGVAQNVVVAAFSILFGGVVLGLALAFGFGGRNLARRYLESRFEVPPRNKPGDEMHHV